VGLWENPGLVRYPRGVWAARDKVSADFNHPLLLVQFLLQNIAHNAAFFALEIISRRTQFI
jgi:hypothetical protein